MQRLGRLPPARRSLPHGRRLQDRLGHRRRASVLPMHGAAADQGLGGAEGLSTAWLAGSPSPWAQPAALSPRPERSACATSSSAAVGESWGPAGQQRQRASWAAARPPPPNSHRPAAPVSRQQQQGSRPSKPLLPPSARPRRLAPPPGPPPVSNALWHHCTELPAPQLPRAHRAMARSH